MLTSGKLVRFFLCTFKSSNNKNPGSPFCRRSLANIGLSHNLLKKLSVTHPWSTRYGSVYRYRVQRQRC